MVRDPTRTVLLSITFKLVWNGLQLRLIWVQLKSFKPQKSFAQFFCQKLFLLLQLLTFLF